MQHVFSRTNMIEKWTWCSTFDSICLFQMFQMLRRRTYLSLPIFFNDFFWFFRAYWRRILLPERILETNDIPGELWKCDLWPRFEKHLYVTSSLRFIRGGVVKYVWSVALPQTTFRIIVLVLVLLFFRVVSVSTWVLIQSHCMWSRKTMSEPW